VRGLGIISIVVLCLSACTTITDSDVLLARRYVNYVPGPPQPSNCGTPDTYKNCPSRKGPRAVAIKARAYVTVEEVPEPIAAPRRESLLLE
jgi:hypothetical protein